MAMRLPTSAMVLSMKFHNRPSLADGVSVTRARWMPYSSAPESISTRLACASGLAGSAGYLADAADRDGNMGVCRGLQCVEEVDVGHLLERLLFGADLVAAAGGGDL